MCDVLILGCNSWKTWRRGWIESESEVLLPWWIGERIE